MYIFNCVCFKRICMLVGSFSQELAFCNHKKYKGGNTQCIYLAKQNVKSIKIRNSGFIYLFYRDTSVIQG